MTQQMYQMTVLADGYVTDADGNIIPPDAAAAAPVPETVTVTLDELRAAVQVMRLTDDQLREAGLDDSTIHDIRSTT